MIKIFRFTIAVALYVFLVLNAGIAAAEGKRGKDDKPFVRGHVIVKFQKNALEQDKERARSLVDGRKGRKLKRVGIEKIYLPPGWDEEEAVELLRRDPSVEKVQVDPRVEFLGVPVILGNMPAFIPDDTDFSQQWYLDAEPFPGVFVSSANPIDVDVDIDAPEAWAVMAGIFDTSMVAAVGVIDSGCGENGAFDPATGYHPNHSDLSNGALLSNPYELPADGFDSTVDTNSLVDDATGWDFEDADNIPADDDATLNYHGTLISGIIGADWDNGTGIAGIGRGRLKVLPLRFISSFFDVIAAVEYAMDLVDDGQAVRVLNMSFKSDNGIDPFGLKDAVSMAGDHDIAVVAAAGNGGGDNNDDLQDRVWPAEYTKDPAISNVLAVAATGTSGFLSGFSNIGPASVQIAAPGEGIRSTYSGVNNYADGDGTSFSTPIAGAALGVVMAAYPSLSPAQAIDRVVQGGDFDARLAGLIQSGKRVNVAGALAPFHPYSGLAYLGENVTISMYNDPTSNSYGDILSADIDLSWSTTPVAAAITPAGATTLILTPVTPGIAQFTLSFAGGAAPVGTYDSGPWRVTAIKPFTAQIPVNQEVTFNSLLPGSVSWAVTDPTVAAIDSNGILEGISEGRTRVILSVGGTQVDYSGWILVEPSTGPSIPPGSSNSGCGTTLPTEEDPWSGLAGVVFMGILLLVLRWKWVAITSPESSVQSPEQRRV